MTDFIRKVFVFFQQSERCLCVVLPHGQTSGSTWTSTRFWLWQIRQWYLYERKTPLWIILGTSECKFVLLKKANYVHSIWLSNTFSGCMEVQRQSQFEIYLVWRSSVQHACYAQGTSRFYRLQGTELLVFNMCYFKTLYFESFLKKVEWCTSGKASGALHCGQFQEKPCRQSQRWFCPERQSGRLEKLLHNSFNFGKIWPMDRWQQHAKYSYQIWIIRCYVGKSMFLLCHK